MTALIADDEPLTRSILKTHLPWAELGVTVVYEAGNGAQALSILNSYKIDIVISDIRMPNMNGIELVSIIRASNIDCQIIFISGFCEKEYLKSAIRLGAVDFIEKPLNLKEISLVLEKAVLRCAVKKGSASHFEPPADGDEKQGLHCSSTIQKALVYIDAHYQDKHISIESIACASFLSRAYLCSLFKKELNITVNNYVQQLRLEQAKHLLKANENTVSEISAMVGYEDPNYFCKLFKAYTQKTPSAYREEMCNDFSLPAVRKEE